MTPSGVTFDTNSRSSFIFRRACTDYVKIKRVNFQIRLVLVKKVNLNELKGLS